MNTMRCKYNLKRDHRQRPIEVLSSGRGRKRSAEPDSFFSDEIFEKPDYNDYSVAEPIDEDVLLASICRDSFYEFLKEFWSEISAEKPVWNWHIKEVCDVMQEIAERVMRGETKLGDVIINIPPGTTKSSICSVAFEAWVWTKMPHARFMCIAHTVNLAFELARLSRDIVTSPKYKRLYPGINLRDDQNTKGMFLNNKKGFRFSVGSLGSVIGRHFHFIIIDDPIDPQAALSETEMMSINRWLSETVEIRKVDKLVTVSVLVMQRLHESDCTADKMTREPQTIQYVLPADISDPEVAELVKPPSLKQHYADGLLDSVRLSRKALEQFRAKGSYYFSGQFDQNPSPVGGGLFKIDALQIRDVPPAKFKRIIRYWDKAACLIAGTAVETIFGAKLIEQVQAGDYVLTRDGYKEVEWAGESASVKEISTVLFSNGVILTGTEDHPVWTENRNWVGLAMLADGDYNTGLGENQIWQDQEIQISKLSTSKACGTPESRASGILKRGSGIRFSKSIRQIPFIGQSGGITTGIFPLARISTILTKTTTTIQLEILNASLEASICFGTGRNSGQNIIERFCAKYARWLRKELVKRGRQENIKSTSVSSAEIHSKVVALIQNSQSIVILSAGIPTGIPVFDIQVNSCHEFFANHILVHNTHAGGAYTVGVLMGKDEYDNYWILDVQRGQWDSSTREQKIFDTAAMDGRQTIVGLEQEGGSGGKESAERTAKMLAGYSVHIIQPRGDKVLRADPFSSQVNAGNVRVKKAPWNRAYLDEMKHFPLSRYKDQIDASAGAFTLHIKPIYNVGAFGRPRRYGQPVDRKLVGTPLLGMQDIVRRGAMIQGSGIQYATTMMGG